MKKTGGLKALMQDGGRKKKLERMNGRNEWGDGGGGEEDPISGQMGKNIERRTERQF